MRTSRDIFRFGIIVNHQAVINLLSYSLRRPLLFMLLVSFVLLILWRTLFPTQQLLYISESLIKERLTLWQIKRNTALLPADKERIIEDLVLQQLLVTEALKMGFDQSTQVQARLAELINNLSDTNAIEEPVKQSIFEQAIASDTTIHSFLISALEQYYRQTLVFDPPSQESLERFYRDNQHEFNSPAKLSMHHVFFDSSVSDTRIMHTLDQIRETGPDLNSNGDSDSHNKASNNAKIKAENAYKLGDTFLGGYSFNSSTEQQLENQFGQQFVKQINLLPIKKWSEPLVSPFGKHLVWIDDKVSVAPRPFEEVKQLIENQRLREAYEQARKDKIDSLIASYNIVIDENYSLPSRFQEVDSKAE